jgi:predicted dehydrogenase
MKKVAIIGAGSMAQSHAKVYPYLKNACVTAVIDPNISAARKLAMNFGVKTFSSIADLLKEEHPDAADLCLPSFLHYRESMRFLKEGIHVFCEKPMAHTSAEADEMIKESQKNGLILMVGQVLRFWPEYRFLKQTIEESPHGPLRYLSMVRRYGCHEAGSWYMDPERCKMVCLEMHIHDADFVNYLFGLPRAVDSIRLEESEIHLSIINTRYFYDFPAIIQVEGGWSRSSIPFSAGYMAVFEEAALEYRDGVVILYPYGKEPQKIPFLRPFDLSSDLAGVLGELTEFFDCLEIGGAPVTVTTKSARDTICLIEHEIESAQKAKYFIGGNRNV